MDRRTFVGTGGLAISIALAGCTGTLRGGGDSDGSDDDGPRTVTMSGSEFQPRILRIPTGTQVRWTNDDTSAHTVSSATLTGSGSDWSFDSEQLADGESTNHTFDEPGAYEYFCTIHGESTMCGVVVVGDTAYDATLPCEGDSGGGGMY